MIPGAVDNELHGTRKPDLKETCAGLPRCNVGEPGERESPPRAGADLGLITNDDKELGLFLVCFLSLERNSVVA